jgi:guanylate cyclase
MSGGGEVVRRTSMTRDAASCWGFAWLPAWLRGLAQIGGLLSDSEELRLRKAVLVLSSTLMASLTAIWVVTYASLGVWASAAIPLVYMVASFASIYTFARMRRYVLFRRSQL